MEINVVPLNGKINMRPRSFRMLHGPFYHFYYLAKRYDSGALEGRGPSERETRFFLDLRSERVGKDFMIMFLSGGRTPRKKREIKT